MELFQNSYFFLSSAALILGAAGAGLSAAWGSRFGLLDLPTARSSHQRAVPKGGGIGMLITIILVSLIQGLPIAFWIPAAVVSGFSFWGDRSEILPMLRLGVHFVASLVFLYGMALSPLISIPGGLLLLLMCLTIVGTSNFYNFMDGINGIAAVTGLIAFGFLAFQMTDAAFRALAVAMAFCCLGFLPFNFPRARVFMGDIGSMLLGFVFAELVLLFSETLLDFICMAALLFPFYADAVTTIGIRIKKGERLTRPHRKHLYQILVNEFGFAHWRVTIGYGIIQIFVALSVISVKHQGMPAVIFLLLFFFSCFSAVSYFIRRKI